MHWYKEKRSSHHISHALISLVVFFLGFSIFGDSKAVVNFLSSGLFGQFEVTATPTETIAFDTGASNNGSSISAYGFNAPKKLAIDTVRHRLFVSDTLNYRVLVFNLDNSNQLVDHQADFVIGQLNFTTNNLADTDKSFVHDGESRIPLAYDEVNDLLFVGDHAGRRVLVFDTATIVNGESAVRSIGPGITDINDVVNTNSHIQGVAVDMSLGYLYVSTEEEGSLNFNTQVQIYDISGGLATITNGQMPIHYLGEDGGGGLNVGGTPDLVFCDVTDKGLCNPNGMAANPGQGLFVTDTDNNRVLYFDFTGGVTDFMSASHVIGASDFTTVGSCGGDSSSFCGTLNSIAVSSGSLYVSDSVRLMRFDISGGITDAPAAVACIGQSNCFSQDQATTQDGINNAQGIAVTATEVWLADSTNHRVLQYAAPGSDGSFAEDVIGQLVVGATYSFGTTPIYTQSGTLSGAPTNNNVGFNLPRDVAIDTVNHRLFVADTANSSVRVFALDSNNDFTNGVTDAILGQADFGTPSTSVLANRLHSPNAIAYDSVDNRLFVSDTANGRVLVFDTASADTNESAIHVLGKADFTTSTAPVTTNATEMTAPYGIAYDATHKRLFVSDAFTGAGSNPSTRILVFDIDDGITDGEAAIHVLGQTDLTADENFGTPTATTISVSYGLAYDSVHNLLYAGDYTHNRVLVYDTDAITDGEAATHILGASDFTTINSTSHATSAIHVLGLSLDHTGNQLYVSTPDGVIRFDVATIIDNETRGGLFAFDNDTATQYQTHDVYGTEFDTTNNRLYVVDNQNSRVLYFDFVTIDPATPASYSATVGQVFTTTPATSNGQGAITFEVVSGTAPPGITFGSSIEGTPTVSGTYNFTIRAVDTIDTGSSVVSPTSSITITVAPAPGGGTGGVVIIPPTTTTTGGTGTTGTSSTTTTGTTTGTTVGTTTGSTGTPSTTGGTTSGVTTGTTTTTTGTTGGTTPGTTSGPTTTGGFTTSSTSGTGGSGSDPCIIDPSLCYPTSTTGTATTAGTGVVTTGGEDNPPPYEDDCPGNLFNTVVCIVEDSIDYTEGTLSDTIGQIRGLLSVPSNDIISKLIGIVGILAGALFTLLPVLFTNPLSFSELLLLPARLWSLLLVAFGIKKRNRPWGRVYDSITKQPLDPVYVSLQDNEGNEVASSITDIDGRYGFLVEPGLYRMIPKKTHYSFPSAKLIGKTRDELYLDLYFGYIFEVKEAGEVITKNIPMDPDTFDWNEFAKQEQTLMRFYSKRDRVFARIADFAFSIGLTVSTIALLVAPTAYNVTIFGLYLVLLVVKEVGFRQKSSGTIVRKGTDLPVPFAIIRIISSKTKVEVLHKVTNILGRYYALVGNGMYDVTIETKNADGSYTLAMKKENIEIKDGLLKQKFEV